MKSEEEAPAGTIQLLVILLAELTRTGRFAVEISMKQVLNMKGIGNNSTNTKNILKGLAHLDQVRFQYRHSQKGWQSAPYWDRQSRLPKRRPLFPVRRSMATLVPARQFMYMPETAMTRNYLNENVDARLFLTWRICQHKRMNLDKRGADLVPARTLLACCPAIISYRELKDKQTNQRIVEPLQQAWDLAPYYSCAFKVGETNDDSDAYEDIIRRHVRVTWSDECPYPVDAAFIKRKAKSRAGKSK